MLKVQTNTDKLLLRTRQLALGTMNLQHLGLEAQLSPCFQSNDVFHAMRQQLNLSCS